MGEASYKAMRASEMDDVIFSGNNQRPSRNHAEVAVQVDNSARNAPAAFNDDETLEVSRRIVREQARPSGQRARGASPRRRHVDAFHRFVLASAGASGPHRRDHPGAARAAPARLGRSRRHFRPARAAPRGRLKAAEQNLLRVEDVMAQLAAQAARKRRPGRRCVTATYIGASARGVAVPPALDRGRYRGHGRRARAGRGRPRRCRPRQLKLRHAGRACRRASGASRARPAPGRVQRLIVPRNA